MKYEFRLKVTPSVDAQMTKAERARIVKDAVTDAEKHDLKTGDYAIYHAGANLRVVVDFPKRTVHVMTADEYAAAGLPECPHMN